MTSHPLPPHDEDDDQDLRALYRSLPSTEPSEKLDAAVRQVAARAAAADRNVQQPRRRWHPGWGVAATVVLVTGLFFLTDLNHPDRARLSEVPPVDNQLVTPPKTMQRSAPASASQAPSRSHESAAFTNQIDRRTPANPETATLKQRSAPMAVAPAPAPSADQSAATEAAAVPDDAAPRIAHIRTLLQQSEREKALQALRDLQRDMPDVTLPADLQQLLPKQP